MDAAAALGLIASKFNEQQRAYLLAAYDEDQVRVTMHIGPGVPPAGHWRWIEYGPVLSRRLHGAGFHLLRAKLAKPEIITQSTGAI